MSTANVIDLNEHTNCSPPTQKTVAEHAEERIGEIDRKIAMLKVERHKLVELWTEYAGLPTLWADRHDEDVEAYKTR